MNIIFFKGDAIICANCNDHIADWARDMVSGDVMNQECFEWKNQVFVNGEAMKCRVCQYDWGQFMIQSSRGGRGKSS